MHKGKGLKIKRYGRIYRDSKRSPSANALRWTLGIAAVLVAVFVGYNAYGPIRDYLSGEMAAASRAQAPASQPAEIPAASRPAPDPEPDPKPIPGEIRAVYLPPEVLLDAQRLDAALEAVKGTPLNAVLFDLKDADGRVLYRSSLDTVSALGSQAESAYDLKALCGRLSAQGLWPVGRVYCFNDPYAGRLEGGYVRYLDSDVPWLDNAEEAGGRPWLNPYSQPARDYLTGLAGEAAGLGVRRLLLDGYSFPTGYGQELASYGGGEGGKPEALRAFVEAVGDSAAPHGCGVSLYLPAMAALGESNLYYGGVNPATLSDDLTLGVMPAQFGDGYASDGLTLSQPLLDPAGTVGALLDALSPSLSGKRLCGVVQAYTASNAVNNRPYTAEDITAQITALRDRGVENYIVYTPDGYYPAG